MSPSPVAVKTQNSGTEISYPLNPNATPFINNFNAAAIKTTTNLISLAPAQVMTSAPLPLNSMRPPLLPHQFFHQPSSSSPELMSPPPSPSSSSPTATVAVAPVIYVPNSTPYPNYTHLHYYYYHCQTALYTSIRPNYPHPASSAAGSPSYSFPCSFSNEYYRGVQMYSHQTQQPQPQNVVVSCTVQPKPGPKARAGAERMISAERGKIYQRRFKMGMMTRRKVAAARGGSHRFRVSSSSSSAMVASGGGGEEKVTSLMIRNIPNLFQRRHLLNYLDRHCSDENQKSVNSSGAGDGGFVVSEYDFVYLPMDFRTGANLGYAFVNFTSSVAASRFRRSFDNYKWYEATCNSKICEITPAVIQGKEGLMNHFKNSRFRCKFDYYLPVVFSPPRGGPTTKTTSTLIGLHLPPRFHHRRGGRRHRGSNNS